MIQKGLKKNKTSTGGAVPSAVVLAGGWIMRPVCSWAAWTTCVVSPSSESYSVMMNYGDSNNKVMILSP